MGAARSGTDGIRASLLAERRQVQERAAAAERDFQRIVEAGQSVSVDDEHDPDGAGLAVERSQIVAFLDQAQEHLARIVEALDRLAAGRYPDCETCGGPIGTQRLAARPSATRCIGCAGRAQAARRR
jgi:RNA polymerase-binding transcription factor DksA